MKPIGHKDPGDGSKKPTQGKDPHDGGGGYWPDTGGE